jgi:hypothetical protein
VSATPQARASSDEFTVDARDDQVLNGQHAVVRQNPVDHFQQKRLRLVFRRGQRDIQAERIREWTS